MVTMTRCEGSSRWHLYVYIYIYRCFVKMVTPRTHLFDLHYCFSYGMPLVEKPSIAYGNQQEPRNTFSMLQSGSIHVARVKTLQVHTMISTCIDVDTRWKGPIHFAWWDFVCFFFPAETQKKNTDPKIRRGMGKRFVFKALEIQLSYVLSQKRSSKVNEWRASKLAAVVCSTPLTLAWHGFGPRPESQIRKCADQVTKTKISR